MRCKVQTISKSVAKELAFLTNEIVYTNVSSPLPQQYYLALLDMINSKFAPTVKNKKKDPRP